jgi:DNA repair exonuclease SbcCD ATPase subunit
MKSNALSALALVAAVTAGCGEGAAIREMTAQRAEIVQELDSWKADVTAWTRDIAQMKQWHRASSEASNGQETADRLAAHAAKLEEHERAVSEFERELREFGEALDDRRRRSRDELARHAGLWSEHLRLEVKCNALASVHQELNREQAELAGDAATRRS